jgi:hypothetical protein
MMATLADSRPAYPPPASAAPSQRTAAESLEFTEAFDESLANALDLDTWTAGDDLAATYARIESEVADAVAREDEERGKVRKLLLPQIQKSSDVPETAGWFSATQDDLERVHRGLLFNGAVEACDGTSVVFDTVPLTITQIGVCLVSYSGEKGAWMHRLFRRDLRARLADPIEELKVLFEKRERREAAGQAGGLSELARRGIMAYAERAILREKSVAQWRMGHGSPAPYELLTGLWSSHRDNINVSLDLIRWYALDHRRFVFVPSAPKKRHWLTLGNALRPMEYAIIRSIKPELDELIDKGGYREGSGVLPAMQAFAEEVGPEIVVGVYRVWEAAPPFLFYAHRQHAHLAAHIAMADSVLQEHRGFPMLIDLADAICSSTFSPETFTAAVQTAYSATGRPFQYLGERETRPR